jgi:hypothetical protein
MKFSKRIWMTTLIASLLFLSGCYSLIFKQQDMKNVRRQFHLPRAVSFQSFDSYPKTPGFFGREGLRITATLAFSKEQFEEYIGHLNDDDMWEPVSYLNYSPSIGDEYSTEALHWKGLPLPDSLTGWFDQLGFEPKGLDVQQGKYYCSVILTLRGEPLESNPAAYHWNHVGRACSELSKSEYPTILAFAVLDYEKRLIHIHIQF